MVQVWRLLLLGRNVDFFVMLRGKVYGFWEVPKKAYLSKRSRRVSTAGKCGGFKFRAGNFARFSYAVDAARFKPCLDQSLNKGLTCSRIYRSLVRNELCPRSCP